MIKIEWIHDWLIGRGLSEEAIEPTLFAVSIVSLIFVAYIVNLIAKQGIIRILNHAIVRTKIPLLLLLKQQRVLIRLSHIAPAIAIERLSPTLFAKHPNFLAATEIAVSIYLIVIGLLILDAILNVISIRLTQRKRTQNLPLKGLIQATKLLFTLIAIILVAAVILGKSPLLLMSGLGALTAVLLLIFKDAILGLVAGVQLSANNMIQNGDWITMPQRNADGTVIDVSLTTVKVQNFDRTITTIPSYLLISESFKNWRGMRESGGRRIKRAIYIDIRTIGFLDDELLANLQKIRLLQPYLKRKLAELNEYNRDLLADEKDRINGRHLTNIGTFRAYCNAYIDSHPSAHPNLVKMARLLEPGPHGLPLEIYLFANTTLWTAYEAIQGDIFDHLLAILPTFNLRAFQQPSGADIESLSRPPKDP